MMRRRGKIESGPSGLEEREGHYLGGEMSL